MTDRYVKIKGNNIQRGEQIGKLLRESIQTIFKVQDKVEIAQGGSTLHDWTEHAKTLFPYIEKFAPNTYEEMVGMAKGSGIELEKLLLLTCTYEKWMKFGVTKKCTAFAAINNSTENSDLICGQTNDEDIQSWCAGDLDVVYHHIDTDNFETFIYSHPGIPAYMGMNSAGLCVLWTYIDNGDRASGVPTNSIIRELLFKKSVDSGVEYLESIPHCVPNTFILSHPDEKICTVEVSAQQLHKQFSGTSTSHANYILNSEMAKNDLEIDYEFETSFSRCDSLNALLQKHDGNINLDIAKKMLADHTNAPASVCVHPRFDSPNEKTLASMIFHPNKGSMHIAFGNGCRVPYEEYKFENKLTNK